MLDVKNGVFKLKLLATLKFFENNNKTRTETKAKVKIFIARRRRPNSRNSIITIA